MTGLRLGPAWFSGPGRYGLGELTHRSLPLAGPLSDVFGSTTPLTYPDGSIAPRPYPHRGIDVEAPEGTPVRAPAPGVVLRSGFAPTGAGFHVVLRHASGLQTHYYHLAQVSTLTPGQRVRRGARVGVVGSTGFSSGPHLHLGVFDPKQLGYLDPLAFLWLPECDEKPPTLGPGELLALDPRVEPIGYEGPDAAYKLRLPRHLLPPGS